jgi:phospholipase/carboxylesterase
VSGIHDQSMILQAGEPVREAAGAVVLLHGRGGSAQDILGLARSFGGLKLAFIAPEAAGNTWYPQSFLSPREQNEPYLSSALEKVRRVVDGLIGSGVSAEKIVIGGFSQGACLTSEFIATHPRRYAGALIFTGGLIGPPGTDVHHPGDLADTPVFLANGSNDPHIPWTRTLETASALRAMGAVVDMQEYPGRPHTITADEVARARTLLEKAFRSDAV